MTTEHSKEPNGWINDAATHLDDHVDVTEVVDKLAPRLRATVRNGTPIVTDDPGIEISTRALRQVFAHAVHRSCRRDLTAIDIVADHKSIKQVRLDMVARYGDSLEDMSGRARAAVRDEMTALQIIADGDVDVRWVDVDIPAPARPEPQPMPLSEPGIHRL